MRFLCIIAVVTLMPLAGCTKPMQKSARVVSGPSMSVDRLPLHTSSSLPAQPQATLTPEDLPAPFTAWLPSRSAIVQSATRLIGARTITSQGRRIAYDCAGVAHAIFLEHGIDLYRSDRHDVNANGVVTSLDALLVINRLMRSGGQASIPVGPNDRGPDFYDVNGNLFITALDALLVINHIGQDAPVVSSEFVGQPIVADMASSSDKDTETRSIDTVYDSTGLVSNDKQKPVDLGVGNLVDAGVVDLLAEAREAGENDESESIASTLNDLAILDLL